MWTTQHRPFPDLHRPMFGRHRVFNDPCCLTPSSPNSEPHSSVVGTGHSSTHPTASHSSPRIRAEISKDFSWPARIRPGTPSTCFTAANWRSLGAGRWRSPFARAWQCAFCVHALVVTRVGYAVRPQSVPSIRPRGRTDLRRRHRSLVEAEPQRRDRLTWSGSSTPSPPSTRAADAAWAKPCWRHTTESSLLWRRRWYSSSPVKPVVLRTSTAGWGIAKPPNASTTTAHPSSSSTTFRDYRD